MSARVRHAAVAWYWTATYTRRTYVLEVTKLSAAGTPGQNLRPVGHIIWHNAINVPCNRLQTAVQGAGNDRITFSTPYRRTCTD